MSDSQPLWRPAGRIEDLEADEPHGVEVIDRDDHPLPLVLVRRGDRVFALHDRCPHRGAPFSELGLVDDEGTLICGWHYWGFGLETGRHTQVESIRVCTFPVRITDGAIEIDVGDWTAPNY